MFKVRAGSRHGHWVRESGVRVEDLGHEEGYPARGLVTGAVHEITFALFAGGLLNRLSEVSFMRNLYDVLPNT